MIESVKNFTLCLAAAAAALAITTVSADAATITFEGYAPNGGLVTLPPDYTESGFILSYTGYNGTTGVAVFGAGASGMVGNLTSNLGWNTSYGSSVTLTGPESFDLLSVDLGAYIAAPGDKHTNITLTGNVAAGGTLTKTFEGLLGATTETLNWTGLQSVVFTGTYYGTMDNIVTGDANAAPEPGTMLLLGAGVGTLVLIRRRRKPSAK
ncbi:MAG: hypothetical protein JWN34_6187 [Bryobacterales bacterium]|jgi:hypothetical protein|nr:hypothetical protein [Bryobacterales bacterium]